MHSKNVLFRYARWLLPVLLGLLAGCGDGDDGVVVRGDFPIAYVDRAAAAVGEPADGVVFVPGGDLYLRELASPSAASINLTRSYTQGRGDVTGPEASYDGRRIVFSMRGPNDATWSIWEYSLDSRQLQRLTDDTADDVDPHYLPDGRIVFSSNRQAGTRQQLEDAGRQPYSYRTGYGREAALVLHVMNADGSDIEQISFNQSHDRNPTVRMNGEIMYARWEHMGNRNQQPIFTIRPDGSRLDVLYGAFSPGDAFLHPRELPDGRVISTVLPLAGSRSGGALVIADVRTHSDHARRLDGGTGAGQHQPTLFELPLGRQTSRYGRYSAPYPLWDGSNRVLVAWSPLQAAGARSPVLPDEPEPRYGIYMLNLDNRSLRPIVLTGAGRVLTDPVAVMPRPVPAGGTGTAAPRPLECIDGTIVHGSWENCGEGNNPMDPPPEPECPDGSAPLGTPPDDCEAGGGTDPDPEPEPGCPAGSAATPSPTGCEPDEPGEPEPRPRMAVLNIRSVYDTDFLDSMGDSVLADGESIPRHAGGRADLAQLRALPDAERPARYLRVSRAVPLPPGSALDAVSGTAFNMQRILGYAPIEPDGSVRVAVPADTPLALAVVDGRGRAFQTHTSWLQARPGEERTCNGCHSPHRAAQPLNTGLPAGSLFFPGARTDITAEAGETMAEARARFCGGPVELRLIPPAGEFWRASGTDGCSLHAPPASSVARVIDYQQHIQPLWDANCLGCHGAGSQLDLSSELAADGRLRCYDSLVRGRPVFDSQSGRARLIGRDGHAAILRERPPVDVGGSANSSRSSYLIELLSGQELLAPQSIAGLPDHSGFLDDAELRLVAEWIDIGAPYRSEPVAASPADPDPQAVERFVRDVHPRLMGRCAGCHLPAATSGNLIVADGQVDTAALNHRSPPQAPNRFVLTGNPTGDLGAALSMIRCGTDGGITGSALLWRPTSGSTSAAGLLPHPMLDRRESRDDPPNYQPVLIPTDSTYTALLDWVGLVCQ